MKQLAKLTDPIDQKIRKLHQSGMKRFRGAFKDFIQCGLLLIKKREKAVYGEWMPYLEMIGITHETSRRYINAAERFKALGYLDAKSLTEFLRATGDLPALGGGGRRNGKPALLENDQFYFNFDAYMGFKRISDQSPENVFLACTVEELREALTYHDKERNKLVEALQEKQKGTST